MNVTYSFRNAGSGVSMPSVFGDWLKTERKKKNLTQDQLAEISDLTKAQISRLESGVQGTKRPTAVRIATALGVDPREALEALNADTPGLESLPEPERIISDEEWELVQAYRGVETRMQRSFKDLLISAVEVTGDEPKEELAFGRGPHKPLR